jgi:hypothetical protein
MNRALNQREDLRLVGTARDQEHCLKTSTSRKIGSRGRSDGLSGDETAQSGRGAVEWTTRRIGCSFFAMRCGFGRVSRRDPEARDGVVEVGNGEYCSNVEVGEPNYR